MTKTGARSSASLAWVSLPLVTGYAFVNLRDKALRPLHDQGRLEFAVKRAAVRSLLGMASASSFYVMPRGRYTDAALLVLGNEDVSAALVDY